MTALARDYPWLIIVAAWPLGYLIGLTLAGVGSLIAELADPLPRRTGWTIADDAALYRDLETK